MDERIKQQYHKIYSEMYIIILCLAAVSVVIKAAFSHENISGLSGLGLEYIILVGSPIYRLIRCRMLGVIADTPCTGTKPFLIRLTAALLVSAAVFGIIMYFRNGSINIFHYVVFVVPFLFMFLITALISKKLHDSWKKRLEDRYDEP